VPGREEISDSDAIDIGRRYDIYVAETPQRIVFYRNSFFRGRRTLEERRETYRTFFDFVEIEQANGETVATIRSLSFAKPGPR
jgi:hypothetical protein